MATLLSEITLAGVVPESHVSTADHPCSCCCTPVQVDAEKVPVAPNPGPVGPVTPEGPGSTPPLVQPPFPHLNTSVNACTLLWALRRGVVRRLWRQCCRVKWKEIMMCRNTTMSVLSSTEIPPSCRRLRREVRLLSNTTGSQPFCACSVVSQRRCSHPTSPQRLADA